MTDFKLEYPTEINKVISDVRYWISEETFSADEVAARFHHRLVWIHPFPNGNGRWARTMADILLCSSLTQNNIKNF